MTTTTSNHLPEVAMLATLNIRRWTGRKTDKRAGTQLAEANGSKVDTVRATKDLIPRDQIKEINKTYDAAFELFKSMTLPWTDDGRRLIPAGVVLDFMARMSEIESNFWSKVETLREQYHELREQAAEDLGDLFNIEDYPAAAVIPSKFAFAYELEPVPEAGDIRTQLPDSVRDRIAGDLQSRMDSQLADATRSLHKRVYDAVSRMASVLSKDKPRIYASLMDDMHALIRVLPDLNLTNDPELARLSTLLDAKFSNVTTDQMRDDEELRIIKATEAQSVLDTMGALL